MKIDNMDTFSKVNVVLLTINSGFVIWFLVHLFENQYELFTLLIIFLSIERFLTFINNAFLIQTSFFRLKKTLLYLLLCLIYMDWKGDGFTCDDYLIYRTDTFNTNSKKHAQFLNSVPLLLIFYHLCSSESNSDVNILFVVAILYMSALTAYLISFRKIITVSDFPFSKQLYFLIHFSAMISYWGLLGQLFYSSAYFLIGVLGLQVLFVSLIEQTFFWYRIYQIWKQIFLVKHVDNLAFFNLKKNRQIELYQSCLNSFIHVFLVCYKLSHFTYLNDFDTFIYVGSCFKIIDIFFQLKNLYSYKMYGPFEIVQEIEFQDFNILTFHNKIKRLKHLREFNLILKMEDMELKDINYNLYNLLANIIEGSQYQFSLEFQFKLYSLSIYNYEHNNAIVIQSIKSSDYGFEFALNLGQNLTKKKIVITEFNNVNDKNKDLIQIIETILRSLEQPLNINIDINHNATNFLNSYNLELKQFVQSAIILEKYVFSQINLNPSILLYDLQDYE